MDILRGKKYQEEKKGQKREKSKQGRMGFGLKNRGVIYRHGRWLWVVVEECSLSVQARLLWCRWLSGRREEGDFYDGAAPCIGFGLKGARTFFLLQ